MKVYVALGGWVYEGYGAPIGVFSTKEKAIEAFKTVDENTSYDEETILEYEVDDT